MGMTIDEAISWIISISEHEGEDIPIYDTDVEAIKMAVSTMRKYQKIEEIIKFGNANELGFEYVGEKITEVVEDGSN